MRLMIARFPLLLGLAFLAACNGAPGSGAAAEHSGSEPSEAAAQATTAAAEDQEMSCWLRNATPEEAMARPSPLGETEINLGGKAGMICYGRPSARDRVVEGGLIPFDGPWRLGANEATAIHLPFAASVGGMELEPGSYSLYANAGESEWTFVVNSVAERWGIPFGPEVQAADIGSFNAATQALDDPVEQFTILWRPGGEDSGHLVFEWGSTRVEFEVRARDQAE
jgi:hypothetical protein